MADNPATVKRLAIEIGYRKYVISEEDAIRLLSIAARATAVKHSEGAYSGPYIDDPDAGPFIGAAELVDYIPPPEPSAGKWIERDPLSRTTAEVGSRG